jgi:hypothetical protein
MHAGDCFRNEHTTGAAIRNVAPAVYFAGAALAAAAAAAASSAVMVFHDPANDCRRSRAHHDQSQCLKIKCWKWHLSLYGNSITLDSQAPLTQWNSVVDISLPSQVPSAHFVTAASGNLTFGNLNTISSSWNMAVLLKCVSDLVE